MIGNSSFMVCPECLTVCAADVAACPQCGLKLDWLAHADEFRAALREWATSKQCELKLRIQWTGGSTELATVPGSLVKVSAGPLGEVEIEADSQLQTWELRSESTLRNSQLPGEIAVDGVLVSARLVAHPDSAGSAGAIRAYRHDVVSLHGRNRILLGSGTMCDVYLPDSSVSHKHTLLVRASNNSPWLVDLGSEQGTFVNRQRLVACQLQQGDLVQVGPYAWVFSAADAELLPVRGLRGAALELRNVGLGTRLRDINLSIPPGQLVAITGPSGGGKSTLIRTILEGIGRGTVLANGVDIAHSRTWFCSIVGYVSQKDVVYGDLTAWQALEFGAELRQVEGQQVTIETRLNRLLRQLDLAACRDTLCRDLSGGESKRVRTAVELVSEPLLLILDEPTSGLDREREKSLMRILRTLAYRGCTVLVVTHSLHHLEKFDHVLVLRGGERVFWGTPELLRQFSATGDLEELDLRLIKERVPSAAALEQADSLTPQRWSFSERFQRVKRQTSTLLARELALLANAPLRRMVIPLVVLPTFFALVIGVAVKPLAESSHLLDFLAILACIWMSASLSLMSIVNEREIFDHERLLFLRTTPYVAAKTAVLWLLSLLQTAVFVLLLSWFRTKWFPAESDLQAEFPNTILAWEVLTCVGLAAVGMGLLISSLAGASRPLANFILPLVMMIQIAFSVELAGKVANTGSQDRGIRRFHEVYGEFTPHRCNIDGCSQRAVVWAKKGGTIKRQDRRAIVRTDEHTSSELPRWTCNGPHSAAGLYCPERPNRLATYGSYLTISRYGDILLRSHDNGYVPDAENLDVATFDYESWRNEAWETLILMSLILPALVIPVLALQQTTMHWPAANRKPLAELDMRSQRVVSTLVKETVRASSSHWRRLRRVASQMTTFPDN